METAATHNLAEDGVTAQAPRQLRLPPYVVHSCLFSMFAFFYVTAHYSITNLDHCKYLILEPRWDEYYWAYKFIFFLWPIDFVLSFIITTLMRRPFEFILGELHRKCGKILGLYLTYLFVSYTATPGLDYTKIYQTYPHKFPESEVVELCRMKKHADFSAKAKEARRAELQEKGVLPR